MSAECARQLTPTTKISTLLSHKRQHTAASGELQYVGTVVGLPLIIPNATSYNAKRHLSSGKISDEMVKND